MHFELPSQIHLQSLVQCSQDGTCYTSTVFTRWYLLHFYSATDPLGEVLLLSYYVRCFWNEWIYRNIIYTAVRLFDTILIYTYTCTV